MPVKNPAVKKIRERSEHLPRATAKGKKDEDVKVEKEAPETRQKLRIKLKAYDHKIIDNSARQIIDIANRYGAEVVGPVPLPTEILKFTVNRSTFVHKDAREQFEMRVHKRIIDIISPNADIIEALRDLNLPSGVDITIKI
ncbi:MAG: 30S ribosomal protein S10 [Parcubacteria group bacterium GW2011_GWA2_37_10]|nr:MAG: 30S ribosomal protein S10 [Parcubacteria group bacterium GW2011_GWA2_37_10]